MNELNEDKICHLSKNKDNIIRQVFYKYSENLINDSFLYNSGQNKLIYPDNHLSSFLYLLDYVYFCCKDQFIYKYCLNSFKQINIYDLKRKFDLIYGFHYYDGNLYLIYSYKKLLILDIFDQDLKVIKQNEILRKTELSNDYLSFIDEECIIFISKLTLQIKYVYDLKEKVFHEKEIKYNLKVSNSFEQLYFKNSKLYLVDEESNIHVYLFE